MFGKPWQLAFIVAVIIVSCGEAQAQNCASSLSKNTPVSNIINCIKDQERAVVKAQAQADVAITEAAGLRSELETLRNAKQPVLAAIPSGAVVAFDLDTKCPKGWTDVGLNDSQRFAGRTLIAVGPHVQRTGNRTTFARSFGDQGGEQAHLLTIDEMPSHSHSYSTTDNNQAWDNPHNIRPNQRRFGVIGTRQTETAGANKQHNNMQPYIALYFCKKN